MGSHLHLEVSATTSPLATFTTRMVCVPEPLDRLKLNITLGPTFSDEADREADVLAIGGVSFFNRDLLCISTRKREIIVLVGSFVAPFKTSPRSQGGAQGHTPTKKGMEHIVPQEA